MSDQRIDFENFSTGKAENESSKTQTGRKKRYHLFITLWIVTVISWAIIDHYIANSAVFKSEDNFFRYFNAVIHLITLGFNLRAQLSSLD